MIPSWADLLSGVGTVFDLVSSNSSAQFLAVVGLILLLLTIVLGIRATTMDVARTPRWYSAAFVSSLVGAMLFSVAGPATAVLPGGSSVLVSMPTGKAIDNLKVNATVGWLIRLIPFNPQTQSELSIRKLGRLGLPNQKYVFVSDYAEVRGFSVDAAVQALGGSLERHAHVSAMIFPLPKPEDIYPTNARGLLQVIHKLEDATPPITRRFDVMGHVRNKEQEIDDLNVSDKDTMLIERWSWASYGQFFGDYCEIAEQFRCSGDFPVKSLIGTIGNDWHPLGFSSRRPMAFSCSDDARKRACSVPAGNDWPNRNDNVFSQFGARIFLMRNLALEDIPGLILIDFDLPEKQRIPDVRTF